MTLNKQIIFGGVFISVIAMAPWPIGFYTFTRIVLCGVCAYAAYYLKLRKNDLWIVGAGLAVLYNPILPVYLHSKGLWSIFNIGTAIYLFVVADKSET